MSPGLWLLVALAAVALAGWAYGMREERVAGRAGPAAVRTVAVFLILGALALPALRDSGVGVPERVVLLDISRSMTLPVRAGDAGGRTRIDSALALLPGSRPIGSISSATAPSPPDSTRWTRSARGTTQAGLNRRCRPPAWEGQTASGC